MINPVDENADKKITALEKKIITLTKAVAQYQTETEAKIDKIFNSIDRLRKALPHVNFEDEQNG